MPRFVSIGEAMVEMAPTGTAGTFTMGFAGDTLNTAWYARRALPADWQVDYVTCVGDDAVSDRMVEFMDHAELGTSHITRMSDRTVGLYLIELQNGERSFTYWRGESAARMLADDARRLHVAFDGATVIYLSGITLAILDPADRTTLLQALKKSDALVAFDPNLRPRLWPDTSSMCAAVTEAAHHVDIALPSFKDEAAYFGDATPQITAQRYVDAGADLCVVKNGEDDILALGPGGAVHHRPEPIKNIVDTTAAGDSFNAGFLAAHLTGAALPEALRAGAQTAAKVIAARGALVG